MQKSRNIILLSLLLVILLIIPIAAYIIKFQHQEISGQSSDWNNFASFIGGILSPVLNIINIIIIYYLALQVHSIEEKRENNNLSEQRDRRLNDFRLNAYKEVSSVVFDVIRTLTKLDNTILTPVLIMQFKFVLDGHNKLFTSLQTFDVKNMVSKLSTYDKKEVSEQLIIIEELNNLMKGLISEIAFK